MAQLRLTEKWLAEHPHVAEMIRMAEEKAKASEQQDDVLDAGGQDNQTKDAPGSPTTDENRPPRGLIPPETRKGPERPVALYVLLGLAAAIIVGVVIDIYAKAPSLSPQSQSTVVLARPGQISPLVAQLQSDLNRVMGTALTIDSDFGPSTLSALQAWEQRAGLPQTEDLDQNVWNQLQAAAEQAYSVPQPVSNSVQPTVASAPAGQTPNSSGAPLTPAANTQQQGSQGMTVSQWLNSIHYGAGGPPANPPPKYLTNSIPLPNGGSWSFTAPYATFDETRDAIMNLPVSALENYSRPPITGRVSTNNDLPVTLEVAGPNGSQVVQGKLDSGAEETMIPESVMSQLGFVPTGSERVIGVTGNAVEPVYQVPVILVRGNNGQWEVLAQNVQVWGSQFDEVLVGANVLKHESLSVNGGSFALAFP